MVTALVHDEVVSGMIVKGWITAEVVFRRSPVDLRFISDFEEPIFLQLHKILVAGAC